MPIYTYKAIDRRGKTVKGELEAASELEVSTQIAKLGYTPISIGFKTDSIFKKKARKASIKSVIIFTRQFATIVKAAVPIIEGLGILAEQSEDIALKEALHQVIHDIQEGQKLSDSLSKHPAVFSDLYVNTVLAGEAGGVLDKVLLRLADVLEGEEDNRANIKSATRYPIMVMIALILAVMILSTWVIPQFAKIYSGFGSKLPLPTQIMVIIGIVIKKYWYITFPSIAGVLFLIKYFINTPKGRLWWDGLKFKMVIIGPIYNKVVMLRFSSMLNVLYQAGLPILKIMDIVKITIGNVVLAREIDLVKKDVADGKGISGGVLASKFFPRLVGYMISIGEKTGALPDMLDSLCEYFSMEVKTAFRNLTSLIEPIMTLVMGVVVAFMAMAIFMPMWNIVKILR